jgi:hypothetical protein
MNIRWALKNGEKILQYCIDGKENKETKIIESVWNDVITVKIDNENEVQP